MAIKRCVVCDRKFDAIPRNKLACSQRCVKEKKRITNALRKRAPVIIKQCTICGKDFRAITTGKVCSPKCRKAKNNAHKLRYFIANHERICKNGRENMRRYRLENPEKFHESSRVQHAKEAAALRIVMGHQNPKKPLSESKRAVAQRKRRAANPEQFKEYDRRKNPDERKRLSAIGQSKRTAALRIVKLLQKGIMP